MPAVSTLRARRGSRPVKTEPFRILVASDAEPSSLGALRLTTLLARRRSASVHALIVATPFPHGLPSVAAVAPPAMLDEGNRRVALEQLRHQLSGVRGTGEWTMRATTGFAADSILASARRWPASLIVLGTGQHGLGGRLIGAETTVKVATHSPLPVLAVPEDTVALPTRARAGVDFSESSIAAATLAATLLGPNGTLTIVYASSLIVEDAPAGTLTDLYTVGARDRLAAIAADIHRRTKRKVDWRVANGNVIDALLGDSESDRCDLIALGAHEPTFLERLVAGRVRAEVLRHAPCCVLVVPAAGVR